MDCCCFLLVLLLFLLHGSYLTRNAFLNFVVETVGCAVDTDAHVADTDRWLCCGHGLIAVL